MMDRYAGQNPEIEKFLVEAQEITRKQIARGAEYGAPAGSIPVGGQDLPMHQVQERYAQGDHLIDGGPGIGLFWATDVSALGTHRKLPIEHAYSVIQGVLRRAA